MTGLLKAQTNTGATFSSDSTWNKTLNEIVVSALRLKVPLA
jgi:hypothetical protein